MNDEDYESGEMNVPRRGVLAAGSCIAAVLAACVSYNLLSGQHPAFERMAAAPAMVVKTVVAGQPFVETRSVTAGKGSNTFPSANVSVKVDHGALNMGQIDPLTQLILQTGDQKSGSLPQPSASVPEVTLVLLAQQELAAIGLFDGAVDGLPGGDTRDAVRKYQALNGFAVTGVVTQPIVDHLQLASKVSEAGNTSVELYNIQNELTKLGYSPGVIDGRLGEQTRVAIRTFEADRGWPVTGELSDALVQELAGSDGLASVAVR